MKSELLQNGVLRSKTFKIGFEREHESALIERNGNADDFLKLFSHEELMELRELLWHLEYDKLLVREVK